MAAPRSVPAPVPCRRAGPATGGAASTDDHQHGIAHDPPVDHHDRAAQAVIDIDDPADAHDRGDLDNVRPPGDHRSSDDLETATDDQRCPDDVQHPARQYDVVHRGADDVLDGPVHVDDDDVDHLARIDVVDQPVVHVHEHDIDDHDLLDLLDLLDLHDDDPGRLDDDHDDAAALPALSAGTTGQRSGSRRVIRTSSRHGSDGSGW